MSDQMKKKDGFCRAPRVELVSEGSEFETIDFDELLNKAAVNINAEDTVSVARAFIGNDTE